MGTNTPRRKSPIHSQPDLYPKTLRIRQTDVDPKSDAARGADEIEGLRIPRVRQLRPHEDVPEGIPPLDIRRRDLTAAENQRGADGGRWREHEGSQGQDPGQE